MDEHLYDSLKILAIVLAVIFVGWTVYDSLFTGRAPGDYAFQAATREFSDGRYRLALEGYRETLQADPDNVHAVRGVARSLMQLGRHEEALAAFNRAIEMTPDFAGAYANRGILHDRMGRYAQALADYEKSLTMNPDVAHGPGWLTRFLRNQPEKPPTVADRATYLRAELAKPPRERLLRVPKIDRQQRTYKQ